MSKKEQQTELLCPQCGESFPYRSNKRFCSPRCRKTHATKRYRVAYPRNATNSPSEKRQQAEDFDLALRLAESLYARTTPINRLGFMEALIQIARNGESPQLRRILTNPDLIFPDPTKKYLFHRRAPAVFYTISQAANRYCLRSSWGASVVDVVRGNVPEPETGEITEELVVIISTLDHVAA